MTIYTDTFGDIDAPSSGLKDNLDEVFMDEFIGENFEFEQVFKVEEMTELVRNESKIQYPVRSRTVSEGGSFHRVEMQQVRTKQYVMEFIKTEMKITREAMKYQKFQELKDGAKALAQVMHTTIEELAQSVFLLGFTTLQTPDGVSLFNTLHPIFDADAGYPTTQSNRSNLKLNPTNLKLRRTALRKHRNEKGALSKARADRLICGPDQEFNAQHCMQDGYEPFSANLTSNIAGQGLGGKPIVLSYIADSDYPDSWFLQDSKRHMLKFFWGQKPKNWIDKDPNTADWLYRTEAHICFGASDYVGIDGNTGEV